MKTPVENPFGPRNHCFACGADHPFGFHLRFSQEDEWVHTSLDPRPEFQGAPGLMHGGLISTLADEIAAWALVVHKGRFGFTGEMTLRYRKPVRTKSPIDARARIKQYAERLAKVEVIIAQDGQDACAGMCSFVMVDEAGAEKILGAPLPKEWHRFLRASS